HFFQAAGFILFILSETGCQWLLGRSYVHGRGPRRERGGNWQRTSERGHALGEFLGLVVQRVHHPAHALNGLQGRLKGLVHASLLEDHQHARTLVQDSCVERTPCYGSGSRWK
ncbi:unnamed protein product, partial [Ixodes pacificus]